MRKFNLFLLILFLFNLHGLKAQLFVDASATGMNDGTSWADAYTDLNNAITNAPANSELWIAAGVYKPGNLPTDYFSLTDDLKLYGGFNGTETMLSQRNYQTNLTILSGDLLGDDIPGDFLTNRTDNSIHIAWCQATITNSTVIDGIIFEGGNTKDGSGSGDERRGACIFTFGSPIIQNCTFRDSYGYFGAGVYPRNAMAEDTKVLNCVFEDNYAEFGAAIVCAFADVLIEDCIFRNNVTLTGAAVTPISTASTIRRCDFTNNTGGAYGGAGILAYDVNGFANPNITIEDCNFEQNHSPDFGGAVSIQDNMIATISRCTFVNNTAISSGAALTFAFNPSAKVNNCLFKDNTANSGGAIQIQDSTYVAFDSCVFEGNIATDPTYGGGAIVIYSSSELLITNSEITNNRTNSSGGAISSALYNGFDYDIKIENSYITNNTAANTGGAFDMHSSNLTLINCLVAGDSASLGSGLLASADGVNQQVTLVNTTIADHEGNELIASEGINSGSVTLNLLNTILDNPGLDNYLELSTGATVVSNGGNLSSDASLSTYLVATNDLNNTSANFENAAAGDYHLAVNSPCINNGIDAGAPLSDIEGNNRVGITDQGAFEYLLPLDNDEPTIQSNSLKIFPNPTDDRIQFSLENEWTGTIDVTIYNMVGVLIQQERLDKSRQLIQHTIDLKHLPVGAYQIVFGMGSAREVRLLIKQ